MALETRRYGSGRVAALAKRSCSERPGSDYTVTEKVQVQMGLNLPPAVDTDCLASSVSGPEEGCPLIE